MLWNMLTHAVFNGLWKIIFTVCVLQGYNNLLRDIFEEAGLLKGQKLNVKLPEAEVRPEAHNSLQKCTEVCELINKE